MNAPYPVLAGGYRRAGSTVAAVPRVTIVSTVFNAVNELERTIDSVLTAGSSIDYIIIDGASQDGTVDLLRYYDTRIAYWISEPDHGIYDAMNKGWAAAHPASRVLFLGAGDELISLPDNLDQYRPTDVIYGWVYIGDVLFKSRADMRLRLGNTLHHQALLVPRSLSHEPPFDPSYRVYADFDFNQRLLRCGARFVYSADFRSRALPGGVSSKLFVRESLAVVRRNFGLGWWALAGVYYLYQGFRRGFHTLSLSRP